jgi:hypothetical protein
VWLCFVVQSVVADGEVAGSEGFEFLVGCFLDGD